MNKVFIDTSYLLALELAKDQHHLIALQHWQNVPLTSTQFITTSYIFDEIVTFFNRYGYHAQAAKLGDSILSSPTIQLVHINESWFYQGWNYFCQHGDKAYSLTDCISFVVMTEMGIKTAYTFDHHFVQAGFIKEP